MDFAHVLSDSQIERLNGAAHRLIEDTGFEVRDEALLRQCAAAGASVDEASGRVRMPGALLDELLARAPRTYTIAGLDGRTYEVGGGQPWGVAIVTDPWIVDYATRQPRRPCLDDLRRHTVIAQKMEHIAAISRMDFPVTDVPGPASSLRAWEHHLLHHAKHYYFVPAEVDSNRQWIEIVRILSRDAEPAAPLFTIMAAVVSPLTVTGINVDLMRLAAEYGAPIQPTICPMAGSTSPYTLAGTLLQGHAENLIMAALMQILKPGHPVLHAFGPSVTDMRSGRDLYYTLDKVLWKAGSVQLAKACGLPALGECGGTMTFRYDQQNGMEGILFMLAAVASGADILAGFGSCYTAMGMSAEMMVIQEAWMEAVRFLQRGIDTDDAHLGLDSLRQAGPGGHFLADELTLTHLHGGEFFANGLFDCTPAREGGGPDDSVSMLERAHSRVEELT
ncbi:MAG: trimethylamine methyltransferase family protein, partial [Candidatus Hydrogenedentes bacterium]|nr:trimethylamine methyltransferase family protein [Candidatus Hydrogenedentota bacterium]